MTQPPSQPGVPPEGQGPFVPPAQPGGFPPPGQFPPPGGQDFPPPGGQEFPPPGGQGFPPPGEQGFPPPGGQQGSSPAGGGQQGFPPPGQFPPAGGQQGFPPPGQYPPPGGQGFPPPGQGGFPPAGGPGNISVDVSKAGNGDWIVIGLGVLLLIFSFFGWLSVSYDFMGVSDGYSWGGWHRFWWLAPLLILVVTVIYAAQVLTGTLRKEIKGLYLLIASVVALLIYIISLIDIFSQTSSVEEDLGLGTGTADDLGMGISAGPGFGIWASIILCLAFVYFLALSLQKREKLPFTVPGPQL